MTTKGRPLIPRGAGFTTFVAVASRLFEARSERALLVRDGERMAALVEAFRA